MQNFTGVEGGTFNFHYLIASILSLRNTPDIKSLSLSLSRPVKQRMVHFPEVMLQFAPEKAVRILLCTVYSSLSVLYSAKHHHQQCNAHHRCPSHLYLYSFSVSVISSWNAPLYYVTPHGWWWDYSDGPIFTQATCSAHRKHTFTCKYPNNTTWPV